MDLASKKRKIESSLPDTLDSFQLGPWRVIHERKVTPPIDYSISSGYKTLASRYQAFVNIIREAPLRRYVLDCYNIGPTAFLLFVTSQAFMGLQAASRLHYSNKLFQVLEGTLKTGEVDVRHIVLAIVMRVCSVVVVSWWQWIDSKIRPVCTGRIKTHFRKKALEAQLRLDLLSVQEKKMSMTSEEIGSAAAVAIRDLVALLMTIASTISQLMVIAHIFHSREGGFKLLLIGLIGPVFRSFASPGLRSLNGFSYVNDEWRLRLSSLLQIMSDESHRQEVISSGLGEHLTNEYSKAENNVEQVYDDISSMFRRTSPLLSITGSLLEDLPLLWIAFSSLLNTGTLSVTSLAILTQTITSLRSAWFSVSAYNRRFFDHMLRLKQVYADLDVQNDYKQGTMPYPAEKKNALEGMDISLRDVTFHYPGAKATEKPTAAVRNVTFTLPASSLAVIVGENGSGKSSLVKLLAGLYRPTSGTVLIDGNDAREYKMHDLSNSTAILTQDYANFPLNIGENIGMGDTESVQDMDRIREAARLGGAAGFIEKSEYGYGEVLHPIQTTQPTKWPMTAKGPLREIYTEIEREKDISGGEKQRLAASRTCMRLTSGRTKLLVADEPTSAMDPSGEFELFERLRAMRAGKTVVFITHRFGHLTKHADIILCMKNGELVESGTHRELIATRGEYYRLYNIQAQAFVEA